MDFNSEEFKEQIINHCVEYLEMHDKLQELKDKELELEGVKIYNRECIDKLLKSANKSYPLTINLNDCLIVITDSKIYVEKNII